MHRRLFRFRRFNTSLCAVFCAAVGLICLAPLDRAAAQQDYSISKTASPTTYNAVGQVITYTYLLSNSNSTLPINSVIDDKAGNVTSSCTSATLNPSPATVTCSGTYVITAADIASGSVTNTVTARLQGDPDIVVRTAQATVTSTYVAPSPVLFDPRPQTNAVIERFLSHGLTNLLDDEPDRPRFIRRFPGSLWGGGPGATSSPFNLSQSETGNDIAFSTSLSQMKRAVASADNNALDNKAMTLGSAALYERPGPSPYKGIDVWTEAHFTNYDEDGGHANASGDFNILYVGADYALTQNWLIGVLGQFDWAKEHTKADGSNIDGNGWMVGPYVSGRLAEHLFFDWRAAWGSSNNSVSPFGTYSNSFDANRWLTTARLTGNWYSGNWRLTPSIQVKYGQENSDGYNDSLGFRINGQDVSLGQVEFGPEFGYRWLLDGGAVIEPQVAIYGVWNFDQNTLLVNNTAFTPDDFTGRIEGGAQVYLPRGWSVRGTAAYDGIGSDYDAVTGKVWLNIPLN
jgi:outer membrane autotransporter protein